LAIVEAVQAVNASIDEGELALADVLAKSVSVATNCRAGLGGIHGFVLIAIRNAFVAILLLAIVKSLARVISF